MADLFGLEQSPLRVGGGVREFDSRESRMPSLGGSIGSRVFMSSQKVPYGGPGRNRAETYSSPTSAVA